MSILYDEEPQILVQVLTDLGKEKVFCYMPINDRITRSVEGLRERTEHLDMFLFFAHHSMVFYFRCCVYWWKGSVRF